MPTSAVLTRLGRTDLCVLAMVICGTIAAMSVPDVAKVMLIGVAGLAACLGGTSATVPLVLMALPFWMVEITVRNQQAGMLELALLLVALSTGVWIVSSPFRTKTEPAGQQWLPPMDVTMLLILLAALAAASLIWVADPSLRPDSLRALRRVILEPMFIVPGLVAIWRRGEIGRVLGAISVPAVAVALLAIGQFVLRISTVDIGGVARPIGTFTHPNNLSFYLERAIWFVPLASAPVATRIPRLANASVAVVLGALMATLSRGAAIGLAAGAVVYFWPLLFRYWKQAVGAMVAVALVAFGARFLASSDSSLGSREVIWRSAVHMLRDHPVTGIGLDQFLGQYGRRYVAQAGWPERYTSHPHNLLLDFWLSLGLGGVLVLWILGEAIWRRVRVSLTPASLPLQRAAVAMMVAGLAHGLFDNSFFLPDLATWTWIGLILATPHTAPVHSPVRREP